MKNTLLLSIIIIGFIVGAFAYWRSQKSHFPNATIIKQNLNNCLFEENSSTPSQAVCTFYKLAEKGSIEEAMNYQTNLVIVDDNKNTKEQHVISVKPFNNPTRAKQVFEGLDRLVKIEGEIFDENKAEVLAQTTMLGGAGMHLTQFNLYRIDGQWKIATSFAANNPICQEDPSICYIVNRESATKR